MSALLLLAAAGPLLGCGATESGLVINEVCATTDYIELYNASEVEVDLSGWTVSDAHGAKVGHTFTFPADSTLPGHGFWPLRKDGYQSFTFGLGVEDSVILFDASALVVDETTYAAGKADVSWCRVPDGTGFFQTCTEQTLGRVNETDESSP